MYVGPKPSSDLMNSISVTDCVSISEAFVGAMPFPSRLNLGYDTDLDVKCLGFGFKIPSAKYKPFLLSTIPI